MLRRIWILILLFLPLSVHAAGISYSYAELNYIVDEDIDLSASGMGSARDDDDGWNFNASFAIDDMFFVNTSYSDVNVNNFDGSSMDVDFNILNVGFGGRNRISDIMDVYGVLSYEDFEVDSTIGRTDDSGFGIAGGIRSMLTDAVELNGQVKYTDLGGTDGWGYKLGGLFTFAPNWAANAEYSSSNLEDSGVDVDYDEWRVGLRYIF